MLIDVELGFEIQEFAARLQKQIAKDGLKQAVLIVTAEGFSLRSSSFCAGDLQSLASTWDDMVAKDRALPSHKPEVEP